MMQVVMSIPLSFDPFLEHSPHLSVREHHFTIKTTVVRPSPMPLILTATFVTSQGMAAFMRSCTVHNRSEILPRDLSYIQTKLTPRFSFWSRMDNIPTCRDHR